MQQLLTIVKGYYSKMFLDGHFFFEFLFQCALVSKVPLSYTLYFEFVRSAPVLMFLILHYNWFSTLSMYITMCCLFVFLIVTIFSNLIQTPLLDYHARR